MATKKSKPGRKQAPSSKSEKICELLKQGMKPMEIAKKLKCTPPLVYNVRARMAGGSQKRSVGKVGRRHAVDKSRDLEAVLTAVKSAERERARLRKALEQVKGVITEALG